ncbi:probable (S)-N-methylcoclaurine 3 -hydroxylase isozyme 2 [Olea europaea subsp. europaea]|uniref:Probable (S)-N-methylcoclaurine 3 -hydroxylase isozyme 2 n=1 Tax=Olea europaea subsp. europaea TaxID=158383 RepID=A0A8S0RDR0_OLEEU|nr:probable (S)-N-methylcoclaurine 3 -hydroxylase isozyme 2 [Olea europaea subsp. europaea]
MALPATKEELNHSSLGWTEDCNDNWKFLHTLCHAEHFSNKALESRAGLREKSNWPNEIFWCQRKDGGMKDIIRTATEVASAPNLSDFYPFLSKLDIQGMRRKTAVLKAKIYDMWEPILKIDEKKGIILLYIKISWRPFSIMELFSADTDTTTSTVEWTTAELLKNPEAMMNVRREIDTEINEDFPKKFHLVQIRYLEACRNTKAASFCTFAASSPVD